MADLSSSGFGLPDLSAESIPCLCERRSSASFNVRAADRDEDKASNGAGTTRKTMFVARP